MIKKIQPKDIYKQALAFEKCAKILHDHYDFWDNSTKIGEFMNESLSVELYLKAILLFEKKEIKRTHHFDELFKLLSKESQDEIIKFFNNSIDEEKVQLKSSLESIYNSEFTNELIEILKSKADLTTIEIPTTIGNNVLTILGFINIMIPIKNSNTPRVKNPEKNILLSFSIIK